MPPFTGFFLKIVALAVLMQHLLVLPSLVLLLGRAMGLAFYLNLVIMSLSAASFRPSRGQINFYVFFPFMFVLALMMGPWLLL